jgi:cytochrome oxidase Cu insertion factor (SCO1/SenC/PrrC family)
MNWRLGVLKMLTVIGSLALTVSVAAESLPKIKLAPEFTLTKQDGQRLALKELRGKVLAVTFIFAGWAFLTGTPTEIRDVARRYGIYSKKTSRGDVDHTFLTSLVDQNGMLRVQYMGVQFNPDEMLGDLRSLLRERS